MRVEVKENELVHCSYWFCCIFLLLKPVVKTKAANINNNLMKTATVLNSFALRWLLFSRAIAGETKISHENQH